MNIYKKQQAELAKKYNVIDNEKNKLLFDGCVHFGEALRGDCFDVEGLYQVFVELIQEKIS